MFHHCIRARMRSQQFLPLIHCTYRHSDRVHHHKHWLKWKAWYWNTIRSSVQLCKTNTKFMYPEQNIKASYNYTHWPVQVVPLYPATHAQLAVPPPDTLQVPPFWQGEPSHTLTKIIIYENYKSCLVLQTDALHIFYPTSTFSTYDIKMSNSSCCAFPLLQNLFMHRAFTCCVPEQTTPL